MMGKTRSIAARARGGATVLLLTISAALAQAQGLDEVHEFHIEAQPLDAALIEFSEQADLQLMVQTELVTGRQSAGVSGALTASDALLALLNNTDLAFQAVGEDTVAVSQADAGGDSDSGNRPAAGATPMVIAQNQTGVQQKQASQANERETEGEDLPIEEIVITGTHIKGVKDQFSPVTQISREEMELAGFNNVSDIFEGLPQNFGGGVTIDTSQARTPAGPGSAGVNLRGLGNQGTLVLLNGHRLAAGGLQGNFVDVSTIPATAIDRVDILTDGASAIYGSDAIAGVVNIILRDDFDGAETRLSTGTITDGGGDYLTAGQTLGWSSDRAHAMITYEYSVEEELDAKQKGFAANATDPTWLLPFTQKHSVFASTGAQLSNRVRLSVDGYFNDRKSKQFTSFVSIQGLFAEQFQEVNVQRYGGAVGLDFELTEGWDANLSGSYSKSDQIGDGIIITGGGSEEDGEEDSAITEILSFDGTIGGSLFNITDDPVKGVVGVHYRSEKADLMRIFKSDGFLAFDVDKIRDVFAAFGEISAPIISESNQMPGVESFALSVAARYEEYDDVGASIDPKVGVAWSPIAGLNLRGTYSTSFRAPRLDQLRDNVEIAFLGVFVDPMSPDGDSVALRVSGSREDLDPERSRTWTVGFDFAPDYIDGLLLRGTYFNTEFKDQVGVASSSFDSNFRFINFTGIPVRDIAPQTALDLCARALFCSNLGDFFPALGDFTFDDVEVLLDQRAQNLSLSNVAGFDFEGRYDLSSAIGGWRLSLSGTLLTAFEQKVAPAAPTDDLLNTFGNPVDLRLRGGVQWHTGSMTTAIFVNHVGNYYLDDGGPTGIDSFTTLNATIRLELDEIADSSLTNGASVSFSAINMLNEDPPFISATPVRSATFDAANADPQGRKIGLVLTKRW